MITGPQLADWLDFYAVEPWGDARADLRAGVIASTVANIRRGPQSGLAPFAPRDFMPLSTVRDAPAAEASIDDLRHRLRGLNHGR